MLVYNATVKPQYISVNLLDVREKMNDIRRNLEKFFRGEETKEGKHLIDRWYHYFDDQPNRLNEYSDEEKGKLRRNLLENIREPISTSSKERQLKSYSYQRNKSLSRMAKLVAGFIIVLLALLPVLFYQDIFFTSQNRENVAYRIVSNPPGQFSKVTLADGSLVWLSAASSLRYPRKFIGSIRHVELEGEAFFDVAENPDKPFIVDSGDFQTRVLGTSFNIRGFEEEERIHVTVAAGQVAVKHKTAAVDSANTELRKDSSTVLSPNQQLVFSKKKYSKTIRSVKSDLYTSWKEGRLSFENHSFKEIARRLEQWYGVQIHFTDPSLEQVRFKVTFENSSLEHALRRLKIIENFEFKMEDQEVWLKPSR